MNPNALLKFAFLAAIAIYGVVAWFVCQQPMAEGQELPPFFFEILAVVFVAQILIEPMVTGQIIRRRGAYTKDAMLVRLAFYEAGAIYGLVLTFISHDMNYLAGFGIVAGLLILFRCPVPSEY